MPEACSTDYVKSSGYENEAKISISKKVFQIRICMNKSQIADMIMAKKMCSMFCKK